MKSLSIAALSFLFSATVFANNLLSEQTITCKDTTGDGYVITATGTVNTLDRSLDVQKVESLSQNGLELCIADDFYDNPNGDSTVVCDVESLGMIIGFGYIEFDQEAFLTVAHDERDATRTSIQMECSY